MPEPPPRGPSGRPPSRKPTTPSVPSTRRRILTSQLVALAGVASGLGLHVLFGGFLDSGAELLLLLGLVFVSAWVGGFLAGLTASLLGALVVDVFLLQPIPTFALVSETELITLGLFVLEGLGLSWLASGTRRSRTVRHALRRREDERLQLILEATGLIAWEWNATTDRVRRHGRLGEELGLASEGGTRAEFLARVHPDDLERVVREQEAAFAAEAPFDIQYRAVTPGGRVIWCTDRARVVIGADGRPERVLGVLIDRTEHRAKEEELQIGHERLRTALDVAPVMVFNQDLDLRYTWVYNALDQLECPPEVGKRDEEVISDPEAVATLRRLKNRVIETGEGMRGEVTIDQQSGRRFYDLTVEPLRNSAGQVVGLTSAAIDTTESSRLEQRLREQAEALAESDRRKDEFLAMLSHELRNPLAPIRTANEVLRHEAGDPERTRWAVSVIDRQVRQLGRLVDDLLEVSRITRGLATLDRQTVVLSEVIGRAIETMQPVIERARMELDVTLPDEPVLFEADPFRLTQVLSNLLHNAVKYSSAGSRIELTGALTRTSTGTVAGTADDDPESEERVVVSVRDQGIGIPPEELSKVFDLFHQLDSTIDRSEGGLGIGLTLVQRVVELHGGTVRASSPGRGEGSEFVFELPRGHVPAAAVPAPISGDVPLPMALDTPATPATRVTGSSPEAVAPAPPADAPPPSPKPLASPGDGRLDILVVDDNRDAADAMSELLGLQGHRVTAAYDGDQALAVVERLRPRVVLLDIGLPGIDGYELARRLAARLEPRPTLIAVTGYGQEDDRRRASEAGFDHHLLKPVDLDRLRGLLSEIETG